MPAGDPWLEQPGAVGADGDVSPEQEGTDSSTAFPGDHLLGSTDEAFGRAVARADEGDVAGVFDALAGSTDEAVGRATSGEETVGDAALGGVDEASGRAWGDLVSGDVAGVTDDLAGSTDEAVGRETDLGDSDTTADVARDVLMDDVPGGSPGGDAFDVPGPSVDEAADDATEAANQATTDIGAWLTSNPAGWAVIGVVALYALGQGATLAAAVGGDG